MTPRTHGLVQAIAENALSEAADLRTEADAFRARAAQNDRLAGALEAMHAVASPHARTTAVDPDASPRLIA